MMVEAEDVSRVQGMVSPVGWNGLVTLERAEQAR